MKNSGPSPNSKGSCLSTLCRPGRPASRTGDWRGIGGARLLLIPILLLNQLVELDLGLRIRGENLKPDEVVANVAQVFDFVLFGRQLFRGQLLDGVPVLIGQFFGSFRGVIVEF